MSKPAQQGEKPIELPPPYLAALAICSDLDETPDAATYFELMRFLNTTEETSMGEGVGLEIGNSIYFDMAPGQFSYWNATEESREKIRLLIRSGHIDVLHSYGDLATTRAHAERALGELEKHDCRLKVWVDHAQAPSNFGDDIMQGHGDEPGHPAYHADLTLRHGVQYVWCGRVTSVIGQNRPLSLAGIADWRRPCSSALTLVKEGAKQVLARSGGRKYALHRPNQLLGRRVLRDGARIQEFLRCNPNPLGVSAGDRGDRIHEVLTESFLARFVERRGVGILYTHMGKLGGGKGFPPETVRAFRRLAAYYHSGRLLVTTTSRLLQHCCGLPSLSPWGQIKFPSLS
jgi:hypothetical protein